MSEPSDNLELKKQHVILLLLILQLYPFHVVFTAYRQVPRFQQIFADLLEGKALPRITVFVVLTYHFWILVPILTTLLTLLCLRERVRTMILPSVCLALTLVAAYSMRVALDEGLYAPFIQILGTLGGK